MSITLITCTGGRPEAFALCERWMAAQTFTGDVQWIVVDDCNPGTRLHQQELIRPEPAWAPGQITLGRNLSAALSKVKHDKILFIEDDDYYGPGYVSEMARALDRSELVGEIAARYYNVEQRRYLEVGNVRHASLCQTGMRASLIPLFESVIDHGDGRGFFDLDLYRRYSSPHFLATRHVVGMKGLPGRAGIGIGHRPRPGWMPDHDLRILRYWIGADAEAYCHYFAQAA